MWHHGGRLLLSPYKTDLFNWLERSAFNWEFLATKHLEVMAVVKLRSRSSQAASRQWQPKMAVLVAYILVSVDLPPRQRLSDSLIAWPKLSQSCTAVWGYLYLIFFSHAPFTDIRPALQCADLPSLHLLPAFFYLS